MAVNVIKLEQDHRFVSNYGRWLFFKKKREGITPQEKGCILVDNPS